MTTVDAIAATKREIEQANALMRSQVAAFRRTAMPEVKASFLRITAEIGREEPFVTGRLGASGVQELIEEVELLAWDVPHLLEAMFTEAWIQGCFSANGTWDGDIGAHVYDYLRARIKGESPFPGYFARELQQIFRPLGRLLQRTGFRVGRDSRERQGDDSDPAFTYHRVVSRYRMNPSLISGAVLFGEQARRCYELRERLDVFEYTRMKEEARKVWDAAESARQPPPQKIQS